MSQEFLGAIGILIVGLLQIFGIIIPQDAVVGIITGVLAIWVAIRRHSKGDITPLGFRRNG